MLYDNNAMRNVDRRLAKAIGINGAHIVCQIDYWLKHYEETSENDEKKIKKHFKNGIWWIYNTLEEWQEQLDWMCLRTLKKEIKALEKMGIIITGNFNDWKFDRTKWYSLDYDVIENILHSADHSQCIVQELHNGKVHSLHEDSAGFAPTIPETTTDTNITDTTTETTDQREPTGSILIREPSCDQLDSAVLSHPEPVVEEIKESAVEPEKPETISVVVYGFSNADCNDGENEESKEKKTADDFPPVNPDSVRIRIGDLSAGHDLKDVMICQLIANIYLEKYEKAMGKPHPANITDKTLNTMLDLISDWWPRWSCDAYGVGIEQWRIIIDKHFATKYAEGCDYSLNHFASERIVENRANEVSRTEEFAIA